MNVKRQHKVKGASRTLKKLGNKKTNPRYATKKGITRNHKLVGGWGKKKSDEENQAEAEHKKTKKEAADIAKAEEKKKKADAEAAKKEAQKKQEQDKQRLKAEKVKKAEKKPKDEKNTKDKKKHEEAKPNKEETAKEAKPKEEEANPKEEEAKPKEEKKPEEAKPNKEETAKEDQNAEKPTEEVKTNKEEAKQKEKKTVSLGENLTQETQTETLNLQGSDLSTESSTEEETIEKTEQAEGETTGLPEGETTGLPEGETTGLQEGEATGLQEGEATGLPEGETTGLPEGETTGLPEEAETLIEGDEDKVEDEKPWWAKARNGMSSVMKGTLKKTKTGLSAIGTAIKAPYKFYKDTKYKTKESLKGIKKWAADKADKYSPRRQVQRFRNWRKRTAKAKSDVKFNKYIDKQIESETNIANLEKELANITANNSMTKEEKEKEIARLEKQIKSEKKELKWNKDKAAEWRAKQTTANNALNNYTEFLGKKTGPVKEKLNKNITAMTTAFLTSETAKDNAQQEIDTELSQQFGDQEKALQEELNRDTDYLSAINVANSQDCTPTGTNTNPGSNEQRKKCYAAKQTISTKTQNLDKIKQEKAAAKKAKEDDINKRILKKNSMNLIGDNLQKLTRTMRLPAEISTPGTPQHTELQAKINAHIEQHGTMPPADEISKMVAGTAYEQTLTNTAKDMAKEIQKSTTAGKAAYKTGNDALANISHPQAKTGIINQSIREFIPQLESKLIELKRPLTKKTGETKEEFDFRKEAQTSHLRMTQNVLQTVKQMTATGKPTEEIYKFISRYNSEFGATVAKKSNEFESRRQTLAPETPENAKAVERYYNAEMKRLGYPAKTPVLIAFAKQYHTGGPLKNNEMTQGEIDAALNNYKTNILPQRIANNPLIMDKLSGLEKPKTQPLVKSLNKLPSASPSASPSPVGTNTKSSTVPMP